MRIPRIYYPEKLTEGVKCTLSPWAYQHAIKVLRLREGAEMILFDGAGHSCRATLADITSKQASVTINNLIQEETESPLHIHLGIGISKGERMDYAIQKAVELGVTALTPLKTERCVVNLDPKRAQKRLQHWQGIIISACEQCGRSYLPNLNNIEQLSPWLEQRSEDMRLVLHTRAEASLSKLTYNEKDRIVILIGPEGGLSDTELNAAEKCQFSPIKLGPRILRSETAVVSVLSSLQMIWGDYTN